MRHALIALIAVLLAVGSAPASSIGVYFDQAATLCEASIPIYTQFTWYHCARLDGFLEEDSQARSTSRPEHPTAGSSRWCRT
jgi:hypothetical protein